VDEKIDDQDLLCVEIIMIDDEIDDQDLLNVEIIMINDAFRTPFLARRFVIKIYCVWVRKFIEYG